MGFVGTGERLQQGDIGDAARAAGMQTAALLAFIEVETAGSGFDSRNRLKMLFEPHVFWRLLGPGKHRAMAAAAGLAYRVWGARPYPRDSYPRLAHAQMIAETEALESASWGLPQILGENYRLGGFSSVQAMIAAMLAGERAQLLAMVAFLKAKGIPRLLAGKDLTKPASWGSACALYNGKAYKRHGYHIKCATAYAKHADGRLTVPGPASSGLMVAGMKGEAVRNLQADLAAAGFDPGPIDGRFGDKTAHALKAFQKGHGLTADGAFGPATRRALQAILAAQASPGAAAPKTDRPPHIPGDGPNALAALITALIRAISNLLSQRSTTP